MKKLKNYTEWMSWFREFKIWKKSKNPPGHSERNSVEYEIKLPIVEKSTDLFNNIRRFVILNPYSIPTKSVFIKKSSSENQDAYQLHFQVLNRECGAMIERLLLNNFFNNPG